MRRENLSDEGMTKKIENVLDTVVETRYRNKATRKHGGDVATTARLLDDSFWSYRRLCRDVLIGHHVYGPLRRFGDFPLRRRLVLHLRCTCDVTETCREAFLRRVHNILLPGGVGLNE